MDDDETLMLRIMEQDAEALKTLLELYGPKTKGYLVKHYGDILSSIDIDAALYQAAERAWRYAESFDPAEGSLKSWFMRIAQTQAFDIINENQKHAGVGFDLALHDQEEGCDDDPLDKRTEQQLRDLEYVISHKLEGLQQAIVEADLKSGDIAGADRLATIHKTTKNSIYVSRKKARDNIKKFMTEMDDKRSKGGRR